MHKTASNKARHETRLFMSQNMNSYRKNDIYMHNNKIISSWMYTKITFRKFHRSGMTSAWLNFCYIFLHGCDRKELDVVNKGHIATIILMAQSKDSITSILLSLNGGGL